MKRVPSGPRLRWSGLGGVVACVALAVASGQTPGLRVEGSDLLGEGVVAVLQARAAEMGQTVQANFKGSRPAQDRLVADVSDMAVVVEPLDAEPWSDEWGGGYARLLHRVDRRQTRPASGAAELR